MIVSSNSLVLSSDGAVTVKGRKTFTGVKKLFKLSINPTSVIMVYGKPDFGSVDMESIIEEFKRKDNLTELISIKSITCEFIKFLEEYTFPDNVEYFVKYNLGIFKKHLSENLEGLDNNLFWDYIGAFEKMDKFSFIKDVSFEDIIPDDVSNKKKANNDLLKIFSSYLTTMGTGIVIAGFDNQHKRPSFFHVGLMINNGGEVEYCVLDHEENFEGNSIISFAQDEEINTFLRGINSELEVSIVNYFKSMLDSYLEDFYLKLYYSGDFEDEILMKIKEYKKSLKDDFLFYEESFVDEIDIWKNENYHSFLDVVPFLPKHVLADFAKFLILIVSSKRRYSFDLENVGGDIDVCVVTKNQIQFYD